jgi:non-ribosomal peptide synthetase component F
LWRNDYYEIGATDVNLQMPSFAFDSAVIDIFCVLAAGGTLLIPREELRMDSRYLKDLALKRGAVTARGGV